MTKHFGHIPGENPGALYKSRAELSQHLVHRPTMGGISGNGTEGADSIVISGGYIDDEDHGDLIVYTGAGGRDPNTGRQIAHQSLTEPGNAGLIVSELAGYPIRVTRRDDAHATRQYRYDGLYAVESHWEDTGRDGFTIIRFRLVKVRDNGELTVDPATFKAADALDSSPDPRYAQHTVIRRIRDTAVSQWVKALYDNTCQVCGTRIALPGGRSYAEGAHIRPLGRPHNGPDEAQNILCLCPNHHVRLDQGALTITPDLTVHDRVTDEVWSLTMREGHTVRAEHLQYLTDHWAARER